MKNAPYWTGDNLVGWLSIDGALTKVTASRDAIHRHAPGYNDAISWELERFSADIFEKLKPYFLATMGRQ
jgi:hypothetical protein